MKVRNPWGEGEWKGDWCDNSRLWTPSLRAQLNCKNENDGIFHMSYDDFRNVFTDVEICIIRDDFHYSSQRCSLKNRDFEILTFNVTYPGEYHFTLVQKDQRCVQNPSYEYSTAHMFLV